MSDVMKFDLAASEPVARRMEILDSAWNTANERAIKFEAENERLDKMLREACRRWAAGMNARNVMPNRHYIQNAGEGFRELVRWDKE